MMQRFNEFFLGLDGSVGKVKKAYPNEEVTFSSSATIIETKSVPAPDWKPSFRRVFQYAGALIITENRIVLRTNPLSFSLLAYIILVGPIVLWFINSPDNWFLVLPLLFSGIGLLQTRPYCKIFAKDEIDGLDVYPLMGAVNDMSRISISKDGKWFEIYAHRPVPNEFLDKFSSNRALPPDDKPDPVIV